MFRSTSRRNSGTPVACHSLGRASQEAVSALRAVRLEHQTAQKKPPKNVSSSRLRRSAPSFFSLHLSPLNLAAASPFYHHVQHWPQPRGGVGPQRRKGTQTSQKLLPIFSTPRWMQKYNVRGSNPSSCFLQLHVTPSVRLPGIAQQRRALSIHEYLSADLLRKVITSPCSHALMASSRAASG